MKADETKVELKSRVAKGLNFGIEALEEVLDNTSDAYNDFILLKSKYNDLMYLSSINTMPYDQIELGLDRLRKATLGLIDKISEESLKKKEVEKGLKVQALPTRRTNFFKLLDIHFQNLESINYSIIYDSERTDQFKGREAVYQWYQSLRRKLRNTGSDEEVFDAFKDFFKNEIGLFEVYFKNVSHLLSYVLDSELERQFFLDTVRSLFSRFELAMLLYYALSGADDPFRALATESRLFDASISDVLLKKDHLQLLNKE